MKTYEVTREKVVVEDVLIQANSRDEAMARAAFEQLPESGHMVTYIIDAIEAPQ